MTAKVLSAYVIGLPFYGVYSTMTRARHALKDMKRPLKATIIVAVVNVVLDLLVGLKYGPVGVAVATSFAGILGFLYLLLKEKNRNLFEKDILYIFISSVAMGISTYFFSSISDHRIWAIVSTGFGAAVYLLFSAIFFKDRLKTFLKRR